MAHDSRGHCRQVWVTDARGSGRQDAVAIEEALEIRLEWSSRVQTVTVTMRTPGHDRELAVGFLLAENVIDGAHQIRRIRPCSGGGALRVELHDGCTPRLKAVERNFSSTSSCGLCGKTSHAESTTVIALASEAAPAIEASDLCRLPARLQQAQPSFLATGGLHAVAAFDFGGTLIRLFEDIGRHNAFDKLIGATALAGEHLRDCVVVLSGRAGYEMVQKASAAQVRVVAAIGAPSSLAVQTAERAGITLVGFLRADRCNIYSHGTRVRTGPTRPGEVAA